jgi:hypothetical protein
MPLSYAKRRSPSPTLTSAPKPPAAGMSSRPKTASPLATDTATSGESPADEPTPHQPPPEAAEPLGRAVAAALAFRSAPSRSPWCCFSASRSTSHPR